MYIEQGFLILKNDIENQNFAIFAEFFDKFGTIYEKSQNVLLFGCPAWNSNIELTLGYMLLLLLVSKEDVF